MMTEFDMEFYDTDISTLLDEYTDRHCKAEYGRGFSAYLERIRGLGLPNGGVVLDAGGARGTWGIPSASSRSRVGVLDIVPQRLFVGQAMARKMQLENIFFSNMSITETTFEDSSFDAIICYSVLMFADLSSALAEFNRLLKPGGRLFIQVDLWRWHLVGSFPDGKQNRLRYVAKLILQKFFWKKPQFFTESRILSELSKNNFLVVSAGDDGQTSFVTAMGDAVGAAFYPLENGKKTLLEVCAVKNEG